MAYDGFISYSHAADGELAPALQNALQRLAKPWYRRRALNVFRDETGLSVDPHLWGAIVNALEDAEWFVLLTSPQAAGSEWVNREIEHWKANRPVERILPVVTEGHWQWDEATGDFTPDSTAVPPSLRGVFTAEPRHLDLRWTRAESQLDLRNGRFRDSVAEVAAPLHGRTKDDIEGEDVRQHRRTMRIAWAAASALAIFALLAVMGAGIAVRNADQAEQRRVEADAQRLVAQSTINLERPDLAFLLAAQADRLDRSVDTEGAVLTAAVAKPEFRQRLQIGEPVSAVAYSAADDLVIIGTEGGEVRLHRFSDGSEVDKRKGVLDEAVTDLIVTRNDDGPMIHVVGTRRIVVVDDQLETVRETNPAPDAIQSVAVTDEGGQFAIGTIDGRVLVWEKPTQQPTLEFVAHTGEIADIDDLVWVDERTLVTTGKDGAIRRWAIDTPDEPEWEILDAARAPAVVTDLAVLPDDRFATGDSDGIVRFWDLTTGTTDDDGFINVAHDGAITELIATGEEPDGGSLASTSRDGFIIYWNDRTAAPVAPTPVHRGTVADVGWDPDRPTSGVTGGPDGTALLLDYSIDAPTRIAEHFDGWEAPGAIAIEPGGSRVAVAELDESVTMTDVDEPVPTDTVVDTPDVIEQLEFTPDGAFVLVGLGNGQIGVWDGESNDLDLADAHDGPVTQLAVSPDGSTVASNGSEDALDSAVRLWTFEDGRLRALDEIAAPPAAFGLEFSPDGDQLVIGGQLAFAVHDLEREETQRIDLPAAGVRTAAFDPNGERFAVGLLDGTVRLYDAETLEADPNELRHPARVGGMAFTEDGERLVTIATDNSLRVWRLDQGELLAPSVPVHIGGESPGLALDGDVVLTISLSDTRIVRWPLDVGSWIESGCELTGRELFDDEQRRFDLEDAPEVCTG